MSLKDTFKLREFWNQPSIKDAMHKRVLTNCDREGITDLLIQNNNWDETNINNFVKYHIEKLNLKNNDKILDFGCGVGRISKQLLKMNFNVVCADVSEKMLEFAQIYIGNNYQNNIEYFLTDGFGCGQIPSSYCDAAISHITFQHMTSIDMIQKNMNDINRVLKSNGKINIQHYMGGPTQESECGGFFGLYVHAEDLVSMWRKAGFEPYYFEFIPVIHNKQHFIIYATKTT